MLNWLTDLDTNLFLLLNGLHAPLWDLLMVRFSGNLIWSPLYILLIYLLFKKYNANALWVLLGVALVVALADQSSVHFFKNVFERLRPCHNPALSNIIHTVNRCGGKFGFVSSHAANTFGVATFLLLIFKRKWITAALMLWAGVVGYSRIYLGVHYPGDIVGGALLGALCGWLVYRLLKLACKRSKVFPKIG